MQTLEIISINFWNVLISLCNLLLLFLMFKHFLYQPVKKMLAQRQATIDLQYEQAETAKSEALAMKESWEEKMTTSRAPMCRAARFSIRPVKGRRA